jgi:heme-degrading monooxygenase HmoA
MDTIASTPSPPYYAVIFTSQKMSSDDADYSQAAQRMSELAALQPGYLGMEHVGDQTGAAITVSYWSNLDAIRNWQQHAEHLEAQVSGREKWYQHYFLRVSRVERDAEFKVATQQ